MRARSSALALVTSVTLAVTLSVTLLACKRSGGSPGGDAAPAPSSSSSSASELAPAPIPIPPGPGKPRGPITTYAAALAAARAAWSEEVASPSATQSPRAGAHTQAVLAGRAPRARMLTCREGLKQANGVIAASKPSESAMLFASLPALDRDGTCWEIVATDSTADVHSYLDAKTGALLCAFLAPPR